MAEEQFPGVILYFFALLYSLSAVVVFFSAREGVTPLSVILRMAFVILGGAFVWLAFGQ
ncbi:MAG: hypothetical protein M3M97_00150 [Actinomycetota bacterium]|nr:hypothetical protein [Actinomycetota bacterium]